MSDQLALEDAVFEAEGAAAVHSLIEDAMATARLQSLAEIGLPPRPGVVVMLMTEADELAMAHASAALRRAVAEIARVFHAKQGAWR